MAAAISKGFGSPLKTAPSPLQTAYTNYGTAVRQQGADYKNIMDKYNDVYSSIPGMGQNAAKTFNLDYTVPTYQTTADYTRSVGNLRDTSDRGLYSEGEKGDIRERGISPIRSVYANAQRNVNRQRSLQGGYSPNYAAVSAKMAREMSSQLSDATTRVNAQLAQDIAGQRANAQSQYASTAANEQNQRNRFSLDAADMGNRYGLSKLDAEMKDYWMPTQMKLSALGGMNQTYGTTPAFASLMQTGALNQAGLEANVNQNNANNQLRLMQIYGGR